jgi:ribosomal protein S6--L-glutamate ligase
MAKEIMILGGHDSWECRNIAERLKKKGCNVIWPDLRKISFYCNSANAFIFGDIPKDAPNVVFYYYVKEPELQKQLAEAMSEIVLYQFEIMGATTINNFQAVRLSQHKYQTHLLLSKHNINTPLTSYAASPELGLTLLNKLIGYPAIIKPVAQSWGADISMVIDEESAEKDLYSREEYPIIIQQYFEKRKNRDMRIFVIDGTAIGGMYRIAPKGDFRTNVHIGARVEGIPQVPEEIAELAIKSAEVLNLKVTGIDILEAKDNELFVIETNSVPGFEGLTKATKKDIASLVADYLIKECTK